MKANDVKYGRILVGLARFASAMLSPLLMPTYGVLIALWCSYLSAYDVGLRVTILLVVLGITCVLPMFFIATLHHFKFIVDKNSSTVRNACGRSSLRLCATLLRRITSTAVFTPRCGW